MGYLSDNLPPRKRQIVECAKLYKLVLRVRHRPPFDELVAAENDGTISMIVKNVVPDVEDWQYAGRYKGFDHFRFHIPSHRSRAQEELKFRGFYTETADEP